MLKNRIDKLVEIVNSFFASDTHAAVVARYGKMSAEILEAIVKAVVESSKLNISNNLLKKPVPVVVPGYTSLLQIRAKNRRDEENSLKILMGNDSDSLQSGLSELIIFFVESERMLKTAASANTQRKKDEVNVLIKAFFGNLPGIQYFYKEPLEIHEVISLLHLMSKVLSHRALQLDNSHLDNRLKLNFKKFTDQIIRVTIDNLTYRDKLKEFSFLLAKQYPQHCPALMKKLKSLSDNTDGHWLSTMQIANIHNTCVESAVSAAENMREVLSFADVEWIAKSNIYKESQYIESFRRSPDFVLKSLSTAIAIFTIAVWAYSYSVLNLNQNFSEKDRDEFKQDLRSFPSIIFSMWIGVGLCYVTKPKESAEARFFVFPLPIENLHEMFCNPSEWGPRIQETPQEVVSVIPIHPETEADDVFYDAYNGEDVFFDASESLSGAKVYPKFLTDEEKKTILKTHYKKIVNEVRETYVGTDALFGENLSYAMSKSVTTIRQRYIDHQDAPGYFVNEMFHAEKFRHDLIKHWNVLLAINYLPKIQAVAEVPYSSQTASRLVDIVFYFKNQLSVLNEKIDYKEKLEAVLTRKYDLLLICKALSCARRNDPALYHAMISSHSNCMPSQIAGRIEMDVNNNQIENGAFYAAVRKQLMPIEAFKLAHIEAIELNSYLLPRAGDDICMQELVDKFDELNAFIDRFHKDPERQYLSMWVKKAYVMAIVDVYKIWTQIGEHDASKRDVVGRYQRVSEAFKEYRNHKSMHLLKSEDLKTIMANNECIGAVDVGSQRRHCGAIL